MDIRKYRKKPVEVRAIPYTGENLEAVKSFCRDALDIGAMAIHTLEGDKTLSPGDFVICGVKGEFYPIPPDKFSAYYERVSGDTYRKNAAIVVEAIQFTGRNFDEIAEFTSFAPGRAALDYDEANMRCVIPSPSQLPDICSAGSYVIRNGDSVHVCEGEIFKMTYEPLGEDAP